MAESTRRNFLQSAGLASVAAAAAVKTAQAANSVIRLGAIGCGGRARSLVKELASVDGVDLVAVCDPDAARAAQIAASFGDRPQIKTDLRALLAMKELDAVVIATPDHWHAPASLLALAAGKHVYVEKPCAHNLREGRLLVEAAHRSGLKVQHGTQSRSSELVAQGMRLLREGVIGDVLAAKAWNVQRRGEIGHAKPSQPPAGFDYDMWVGPAPKPPFQSNRHHYTWHWWYDFGTGDMGNDGVHELDIARWGLDVNQHPSRIAATGGKLKFNDDQQFPDTQYVSFDYPGDGRRGTHRQLIFEQRLWSRYGMEGVDNGNAFYGTEGWMLLAKRGVLKVFDERNRPREIKLQPVSLPSHAENFIDAIAGNAKLTAEIEVGHLSAALCHLGNIATRVGRTLEFDPLKEQILHDDEANALLRRTYREGHFATPSGV